MNQTTVSQPIRSNRIDSSFPKPQTPKPRPPTNSSSSEWESCIFSPELISLCNNDRLLAKLIYLLAGSSSLRWLETSPPILGGLSPRECLSTPEGMEKLKTLLLNNPLISLLPEAS